MPESSEPILIRAYRSADLPLLRAMTVEAFDGVSIDQGIEREFGLIHGKNWGWRKGKHFDQDALRDPDGIFVAEQAGRTVGYISTWRDDEAGIGHIPNLVIAAGDRGQGIGRRLIGHACDYFRRHGLSHVRIETLSQNEIGNHLYRKVGFREVARQVHFCGSLDELCRDSGSPPSEGGAGGVGWSGSTGSLQS